MKRAVGTQEAAELLGIKPHILRYWEQEIPLIAPEKDSAGRKVYREQDMRLLYRVRHLVVEKKHTVQGALDRILEEANSEGAPRKAVLEALRSDLLSLRDRIGRSVAAPADSSHAASAPPVEAEAAGDAHISSGTPNIAAAPTAAEDAQTRDERFALESLPESLLRAAPPSAPVIRLAPLGEARELGFFREAGEELIRRGELLLVTASHLFLAPIDGTPAECVPVWPESGRSLLIGASERLRAIAYRLGRSPRWLHLVWASSRPAVEAEVAAIPAPFKPELLSVPGAPAAETLPPYLQPLASAPYATLLGYLRQAEDYPSLVHLSALEEVGAPLLDEPLVATHLAGSRGATARAGRRTAGPRISGSVVFSVDELRRSQLPLESGTNGADTKEQQVSLPHLIRAVGGVAIPTEEERYRPSRYDRLWPRELRELLALHFRGWVDSEGRGSVREVDPVYAENRGELAQRRRAVVEFRKASGYPGRER